MLWHKLTSWENLWMAWTKVSVKGDAAGVDGVNLESFARDPESELAVIQNQLESFLYAPLPVKRVVLAKEEAKGREIGILTVRDRIVHQAIMQVLAPLFEPNFQECSYAYRPGRSALQLVREIEKEIKQGRTWAFKLDIDRFFDTMDHVLLLSELRTEVGEPQVLELVEKCLKTHIFSSMSIQVNETGAIQGSALSPLLSNIYLNSFDRAALAEGYCYYRYSDDLLFLGTEKAEVIRAAKFARKNLALLKLACHEGKSEMLDLHKDELTFVGYSFRAGGKAAGKKAVASWQQKIEDIVQEDTLDFPAKQLKLDEFWTGWKNYYPQEVEQTLPPVHLLLLRFNRALRSKNEAELDEVGAELLEVALQPDWENLNPAINLYFAQCWLAQGDYFRALLDLTRVYAANPSFAPLKDVFEQHYASRGVGPEIFEVMIELAEKLKVEQEHILNAVDFFAERGWFFLSHSAAAFFHLISAVGRENTKNGNSVASTVEQKDSNVSGVVDLKTTERELFLELFTGREGVYGREVLVDGKRFYRLEESPLSMDVLTQHLRGEITAGLYIRRLNDTVKVLVIDLDIGKKYLLQAEGDAACLQELLEHAHETALKVQHIAARWGLHCYIEDSGYRGRHCWFFLDRPIKAATALAFFRKLRYKAGICERSITWEFFPGREKIKKGQPGELIKLPLGVHGKTGRRGLFLQEEGKPFTVQGEFLLSIKRSDASRLEAIAKGLEADLQKEEAGFADKDGADKGTDQVKYEQKGQAKQQPYEELEKQEPPTKMETKPHPLQRLENRLRHHHPLVHDAPQLVRQVVNHCKLVEYLVFKTLETSYLPHGERFTLLCVFGHLGVEGREYLHRVLSHCLNYDQRVTEKFISRLPAKPISCPRIRQEYSELTAGLGCDCNFPQRKGCYPSPVLHALVGKNLKEQNEEKVTVPKIRSETAVLEKKPTEEKERLQAINAITQKLINLRKQQQGITKSINACKGQLLDYFEEMDVERLPMELGTLVLVRRDDETDFIIEI